MRKSYEKIAVSFDESGNQANLVFSAAMLPVTLIYFEIILHLSTKIEWTHSAWMYVLITSLAVGAILYSICSLFSYKINRAIMLIITFILGLVYIIYEVYYFFFNAFVDFSAIGEAGNMLSDFFGNIVTCTLKNLHWIALFMLPFVVFLILTKRSVRIERSAWQFKAVLCGFALMLLLLRGGLVSLNNTEYDDRFYYNEGFDSTVSATRFGLLTSIRLNAKYTIFGMPEHELPTHGTTESVDINNLFGTTSPFDSSTVPPVSGDSSSGSESVIETEPFIPVERVEIDFDSLIANESNSTIKSMHEYFKGVAPTKTNIYTGMFEGKNLIYITAEGFSSKIIDPVLTPTLYKMSTQGFVFNNSYNSLWGGSTATGEYLSITGLFYNKANCLSTSGGGNGGGARLMYYALGNTFKRAGYPTYAFHNHSNTYYDRNLSHPNFGFDKFIAANGNGYSSGITYPTDAWPKSDLEMAQLSTSYYMDSDTPFLAYYMTVSGHANYNWGGNDMSARHRYEVSHLNYSEEVKAYIACNLELELMLANLCEQLAAKGKLEDTVFVISADHYPYALSDSALSELYGLPENNIRENFELYRNRFIIWSASMTEPVIVNKYCSSMDIIPTVYNLFGIEYDSRLLMGIDVLSDAPGLVILNCANSSWHWITDYGSYSTTQKAFTPHPGVTIGSDSALRSYVNNIKSIVSQKQAYSLAILNNDYYRYVFK